MVIMMHFLVKSFFEIIELVAAKLVGVGIEIDFLFSSGLVGAAIAGLFILGFTYKQFRVI